MSSVYLYRQSKLDDLGIRQTILLTGDVPGHGTDDETTVMKNNIGLGIQFATVANAERAGVGRTLP